MTAFAAIASKPGAFADMDKAAIDIAKALVRLSRDLLTRGISYKLQERAYGGLSTATTRKLERAAAEPRRGQTHVADLAEAQARGSRGSGAGSPIWSSSMPTVSSGAVSYHSLLRTVNEHNCVAREAVSSRPEF
jgi:hypothetical protein